MGAHVELIGAAPADLPGWERAWRELEARAPDAPPFVCFDWLAAWVATYRPRRLAVVVVGGVEAPLALGLVELAGGGRLRLAGRPVTSIRGLLAAPGEAAVAWSALGDWLRALPARWSTLDAEGVARGAAGALPGARPAPSDTPVALLPESFDEYMARSSRHRRILRRVAREQAEIREATDVAGALDDFIRLHSARAEAKGERHAAIEPRLAHMLASLRDAPTVGLHVLELVQQGRRLGVCVSAERGEVAWYYNLGIAPEAMPLAPGIALLLCAARDAIERGRRTWDLGPGAFPYKAELGGVLADRVDVRAGSPSWRGRAVVGLERADVHARTAAKRVLRR